MIKKIYLIAFLLLASSAISAQNFVKTLADSSCFNQFVRRINNTEWIHCAKNIQRHQTITRMNPTGVTFPSITLTNIETMYDMEVADNTLFFGGMDPNSGYKFGYIPLTQFPNVNAYYFPFDEKPYRVLPIPGQNLFEVFIAANDNYPGGYCMLNAYCNPSLGNWYFNKYEITTPNYKIDDIAATTNYIVFTVRDLTNNYGYIFSLPHSIVSTVPTARTTQINMQRVTTTAYSTLLVEAATGDTVYVVHSNSSSNKTIAVHKFTATGTHVVSRLLNGPTTRFISMDALDITYNKQNKLLSILTNITLAATHNNVEWHISNGQILSGGSVSGHLYSNTYIESFDHLLGSARNIIAAGTHNDTIPSNRIYRIKDNTWGNCTDSIASSFSPLNFEGDNQSINCNTYSIEYTRGTLPKTTGTTTVSTVCTQNQ